MDYKEYATILEQAINENFQEFFPPDKELRKERLLRLGKEIGVALAGFDEADAKDFIQSSYSRILVRHSLDSVGVVLDMKNWAEAIPNGGKRHPATAAKMKAEGVLAGVWDIFVPVAVDDKCGLWIEMKVKHNKLTASQWAFRDNVGFAYAWQVCYSATAAARAIGEYLDIDELKEIK